VVGRLLSPRFFFAVFPRTHRTLRFGRSAASSAGHTLLILLMWLVSFLSSFFFFFEFLLCCFFAGQAPRAGYLDEHHFAVYQKHMCIFLFFLTGSANDQLFCH